MMSFVGVVQASTTTYSRENASNYGVNKKWKITSNNKKNVLNTPLVDAKEKIYDFANILTDEEETLLKDKIDTYIEKTNMDLVLLTINQSYEDNIENENYAKDFYDYNDFGIDFDGYQGVIMIVNMYEYKRYYGVQIFGDAQLYYTSRYDSILDSMYYDFKNGYYANGLSTFINKLNIYYAQGIPTEMESYYVDDMGYLKKKYMFPWAISLLVAGIGTTIIIGILVSKNKMIRKAVEARDYLKQDSVHYSVKQDILIGTHTTHYTISSSSGGSGGGGGFSSSSGSSGGGSSGGGRNF